MNNKEPKQVSFNFDETKQDFNTVKISIASSEQIRTWSYGEVKKPETINYRTFKPEREGLFCARIFGPVKDYECLCGKYKRIKYKGIICEKCGVEVATSKVRRERMGHIELASPVVHIWFLKSLPSRIGTLLEITLKNIEKVLYFESYIVTEPGITSLKYGQVLTEEMYDEAVIEFGESGFSVGIGAEAIKTLLANIDLGKEQKILRKMLQDEKSETKKKKIVKKLKLVEDFHASENKLEWMVVDVIPVIPPDIRPLVMLDGGRFAASDLNELYRRVINRNNRLKRLIELKSPEIIIRNEKRMLQESVDALFDNSRRVRPLKNSSKRAFKSLTDMLKGKQGRFRQNLLGKRVDYSGRSVIVVGPTLKLHQCGLPKKMALELFKPFIYRKLELYGITSSLKAAKKYVEMGHTEVWDILAEVIKEHPVLLNRAPTLHRLGIQAFEPMLVEGKAITLHPLVCSAFNADFDGDQMAVHVPISLEAQIESRVLIMSTNNILNPSNGKPIIVPSQDMVLGLYYMSLELEGKEEKRQLFGTASEVEYALYSKAVDLHTKIKFRYEGVTYDTTVGRTLISQILPKGHNLDFEVVNKLMTKKAISNVIDLVYRLSGQKNTVIFCDKLMAIGYKYATKSGISFGKDDMLIPESKDKHINNTLNEVKEFNKQYVDGLITSGEKYNKVIDAWSLCTDKVAEDMIKQISSIQKIKKEQEHSSEQINSIYMMAHSGARGSATQIKQLAGMRGLMAKPSGEIIETPIISNFREGLSVSEYFNSAHGARKGLADTALKTANSGYLTRRLVDVAQNCVTTEEDCKTEDFIQVKTEMEGVNVVTSLSEKILGRVLGEDLINPKTKEVIIKKGTLIDEEKASIIENYGFNIAKVKSVLTCKAKYGVCTRCYGRNLATGDLVNVGEAVGVIAAQSIGEPGTQLTMRTFHIGGAATRGAEQSSIDAPTDAVVKLENANLVVDSKGRKVILNRGAELALIDKNGIQVTKHKLPYGSRLKFDDGSQVRKDDRVAEWDPYNIPIISEVSGIVKYKDLVESVSYKEETELTTTLSTKVIIDWKASEAGKDLIPRVAIYDKEGNIKKLKTQVDARYFLFINAVLNVENDQEIFAGDVLARIPKASSKISDITGGLPRVAELFEARKPKDFAIISEISGTVLFGKDYKAKRRIIIKNDEEREIEYLVPKGKHIAVNEGDYVNKGDLLMDGNPVPHDILGAMGIEALAVYMVDEVQKVYKLQGVKIDDKHIEVILLQMLRKVEVVSAGNTTLIVGEVISKTELDEINKKAKEEKYKPATAKTILQGITKASLYTDSFISAASFQETTKVLTEAAVSCKKDGLRGLKENVIVGNLIPAGTGYYTAQLKQEAHKRDEELLAKEIANQDEAEALESSNAVKKEEKNVREEQKTVQ